MKAQASGSFHKYNMDKEYEISVPDTNELEKLCLILPHVLPSTMMPARLLEFTYKFVNLIYPNYFIYAVLSVGIKYTRSTRTDHDKLQEIAYARKSLDIIKNKVDITDPLILWACMFICGYSWGIEDTKTLLEALEIAFMSVKKTKIYCMDVKPNPEKQNIHSSQELEFRRRVWWTYYIQITSEYIFNGTKMYFEDRDIVVNLPKNDFVWKYSAEAIYYTTQETQTTSLIVDQVISKGLPNDIYQFLISSYALFKGIARFTLKKSKKNEVKSKSDFAFFAKKLDEYKNKLNQNYLYSLDYIGHKYKFDSGSLKLLVDTEPYLFSYIFRQLYNSMTIHLYQSQLVKQTDEVLDPEKVKSSKHTIINAAIDQIDLMEWYSNNVPVDYMEFMVIPWTLNSAITMINISFIRSREFRNKHTDNLDKVIKIYKILEKNSEIMSSMVSVVQSLIEIKSKVNESNAKLAHLYKFMEPFGINVLDIEPWIVPKYGFLFYLDCCYDGNYSTLFIDEYLGRPRATEDDFDTSQSECVDNQFLKNTKPSIKHSSSPDNSRETRETEFTLQNPKNYENRSKNNYIENTNSIILDITESNDVLKSTVTKLGKNPNPKIKKPGRSFGLNTTQSHKKINIIEMKKINKGTEFDNYLKDIRNSASSSKDISNHMDASNNLKRKK
ncbi:hypothetical protein BB558_007298 [Smittium angustum]|uniref:Transcription factor domain-containing protein n=1 Tax=Smittium angustum TaxID=133377 RepID=A0A2U1IVE4_SMIAN|nr:hypothetical protein BB558_007298 [Smittium angustum]